MPEQEKQQLVERIEAAVAAPAAAGTPVVQWGASSSSQTTTASLLSSLLSLSSHPSPLVSQPIVDLTDLFDHALILAPQGITHSQSSNGYGSVHSLTTTTEAIPQEGDTHKTTAATTT